MFFAARDKWISGVFPKFSSRPRGGKTPDIIPPPHTHQIRGRCDFEIGPHTFRDTAIFEVHYLPLQAALSAQPVYVQQPIHSSSPNWSAYGGISYSPNEQHSSAGASSTSDPVTQNASTPLLSSLASSVSITTGLISEVNAAAASNPTLANLLQLAATGKANQEQLKSLGLLIQSLAANQNPSAENSGRGSTSAFSGSLPQQKSENLKSQGTYAHSISTSFRPDSQNIPQPYLFSKEFDLVLEFHGASSDRWILPRGSVVCERIPGAICSDILISTTVPSSQRLIIDKVLEEGLESVSEEIPPNVVTFRIRRASPVVWDTVYRWAGGEEKMAKSRRILEELVRTMAPFSLLRRSLV
jgi:hypothetical protein